MWFILPLPVYNPSKSMNQHRGSGGVRESAGAELLPTPISSAEQASQGWSFGFPPPEPQCSCKKTSRELREHAAHVSQCPGSSLALGVPLVPSGTQPLTHGAEKTKPDPGTSSHQGCSTALPWHRHSTCFLIYGSCVRNPSCAPAQGHQCRQTHGTLPLPRSQFSFPPQPQMPMGHKPTSTHCRFCPVGTTTSTVRK